MFSHPSKLELITEAHAAGFHVAVHVLLVPEELTVLRVEKRVATGGHSVPERKVRQRYRRLWSPVREAMAAADSTNVYDNSARARPVVVAQLTSGVPVGTVRWPPWAPTELCEAWTSTPTDQ